MNQEIEQSGDQINQHVDVGEGAQTGPITLIGKIEQKRAEWQDTVFLFFSAHRLFFLLMLVLQVALLVVYWLNKDLHLIPWWLWLLTAVLLLVALWPMYTSFRFKISIPRMGIGFLGTAAFVLLFGRQVWHVTHPERFPPEPFGIAIARLNDPATLNFGPQSAVISGQIYERLCGDIDVLYGDDSPGSVCDNMEGEAAADVPLRVLLTGVMPDGEMARLYGEDIGAEIIVWGELLPGKNKMTTLRFEILETLDRAINPDFPVVMPVTTSSTTLFAENEEKDVVSDPVAIKEIVTNQSVVISAFTLGLAAYLDQDFPQALQQLEVAYDVVGDTPNLEFTEKGLSVLYYYLGKANHALGNIQEGQDWLEQAQALNDKEPAIPIGLALGHGSLGEIEERSTDLSKALKLTNEWLDMYPSDLNALYDRGLILEIREQYALAESDYSTVLAGNPEFYIVYIRKSAVQYKQDRFPEALATLKEGIALAEEKGTNPASAYLNLAFMYEKENMPAEAKAAFQIAIANSPHIDKYYHFYARFLEDQEEMDAALANYKLALDVTYNKSWGNEHLGHFYYDRGLLEKAKFHFEKAIISNQDDALLPTYLGIVEKKLGNAEAAEAAFLTAVSINNDLNQYYPLAEYAAFLSEQLRYTEAAAMYEESLKYYPDHFSALFNLGLALENAGEWEKAIEIYNRILGMADEFSPEQLDKAQKRLDAISGLSP